MDSINQYLRHINSVILSISKWHLFSLTYSSNFVSSMS
uniref:Uncharacterized protein n=1 Tax=Anguilla anguilla TaxID=7936 RepID=A0A0E9QX29_ANGAN